jgi:hypothetical protein
MADEEQRAPELHVTTSISLSLVYDETRYPLGQVCHARHPRQSALFVPVAWQPEPLYVSQLPGHLYCHVTAACLWCPQFPGDVARFVQWASDRLHYKPIVYYNEFWLSQVQCGKMECCC